MFLDFIKRETIIIIEYFFEIYCDIIVVGKTVRINDSIVILLNSK